MRVNHKSFKLFVMVIITSMVIAACNNDDEPTATATHTLEPTDTVIVTEEPTAVVEIGLTIVPPTDGDEIMPVSEDGNFSISVNNIDTEDLSEILPDPPEDFKWVGVDATLANEGSEEPIAVTINDLFLIDTDGNRYSPEEPDEFTSPPLVGETLEFQEFFRGFARFAIPEDAEPALLEWCLDEECTEAIQFRAASAPDE